MFKKKSFLSKLASSAKKATESYLDKVEKEEFGTNKPEEIKKIQEAEELRYRNRYSNADFDEKFNKAVSEDVTVDSEVVDDFDGEVIDGELIED